LEGFSMGGYGVGHLGFKHPDVFGKISLLAPSIRPRLTDQPAWWTAATFFGDQDYYAACHPFTLATGNCVQLRSQKIRLLVGTKDPLADAAEDLHGRLAKLDIPHGYERLPVTHDYGELMDAMGDRYVDYWNH
jgi:endo-1,4-beta-xylanase